MGFIIPPASPLPIERGPRGGAGTPVFIQDQTTQPIDIWMTKVLGTVTTATEATQGGNTVDLEPGHGAVIGDVIESRTAENYVQAEIINVVGNTITVNTPWSRTFPIGTTVDLANPKLNVVGSVGSPVVFSVNPSAVQLIDITRIIIVIEDATAMDFSTFGGAAALTTGCVLRYLQEDSTFINLFNWRTNGEMIERSFDYDIQTKQGGGLHAFSARSTWSGQDKRGVAVRLNGSKGEELQVVVQDDLTVLDKFKIVAQGHVVQ